MQREEVERIRRALGEVAGHFARQPQDARSEDSQAKARIEQGLRITVRGPQGWAVSTDMPSALGGAGSAPSPGWLRRAAQASCSATLVAMRAAQLGVVLDTLEVVVGSRSDDRGMLGVGAEVPAGPQESWAKVVISAKGVAKETLVEIVRWAEKHSPVTDALCRAVPHRLELEVVT